MEEKLKQKYIKFVEFSENDRISFEELYQLFKERVLRELLGSRLLKDLAKDLDSLR